LKEGLIGRRRRRLISVREFRERAGYSGEKKTGYATKESGAPARINKRKKLKEGV